MVRRNLMLLAALLTLALMLAFVVVGCSDDDDDDNNGGLNDPATIPEVTEAMEGIWAYTTTARDCDTQEIIGDLSDTGIDTLCVGDPMYEEEDDVFTDCDVTIIDADSFRIDCDVSETLFDCTMHYTYAMTVNYTSTTVSMTGRMQVEFSGAGCEDAVDECYDISTTATRTGVAPAGVCDGKAARLGLVRHLAHVAPPRH